MLAMIAPPPPLYNALGPIVLILFPRIERPCEPSVCKLVFNVSKGMRNSLHPAAPTEQKAVFKAVGHLEELSYESISANIPVFASSIPKT